MKLGVTPQFSLPVNQAENAIGDWTILKYIEFGQANLDLPSALQNGDATLNA